MQVCKPPQKGTYTSGQRARSRGYSSTVDDDQQQQCICIQVAGAILTSILRGIWRIGKGVLLLLPRSTRNYLKAERADCARELPHKLSPNPRCYRFRVWNGLSQDIPGSRSGRNSTGSRLVLFCGSTASPQAHHRENHIRSSLYKAARLRPYHRAPQRASQHGQTKPWV